MKTGFKVLDNLPEKHRNKIDAISDERANNDGFWIYLENGYCNIEMEPFGGMHIIHEDSPSACLHQLRRASKCPCDACKKE